MAEKNSVEEPVNIVSDSPQRVAFDLMKHIANQEIRSAPAEQRDRAYWLTLFYQCMAVSKNKTSPLDLSTILELDQRQK
jgi:hypothetical protein